AGENSFSGSEDFVFIFWSVQGANYLAGSKCVWAFGIVDAEGESWEDCAIMGSGFGVVRYRVAKRIGFGLMLNPHPHLSKSGPSRLRASRRDTRGCFCIGVSCSCRAGLRENL